MNICTKYGFDILIISGCYGGHRRHTTDAGQRHGYGISSPQVSVDPSILNDRRYNPIIVSINLKQPTGELKRFSEKPIVAFTNTRVFILDFHIYD